MLRERETFKLPVRTTSGGINGQTFDAACLRCITYFRFAQSKPAANRWSSAASSQIIITSGYNVIASYTINVTAVCRFSPLDCCDRGLELPT